MPRITLNMNDNVKSVLEETAKRNGISMSAYVSLLIMKADTEFQMTRLLKLFPEEQLRAEIEKQTKGGGMG